MNQNEMVRQLGDNELNIHQVFGSLPANLETILRVNSNWSVRDELAHIVAWLEEIDKEIRFIAEEGDRTIDWEVATDSSPRGYDKWNQAELDRLKGLTINQLLKRYVEVNGQLKEFVGSLPDSKLKWTVEIPFEGQRTIPQLVEILTKHERGHSLRSQEVIDKGA